MAGDKARSCNVLHGEDLGFSVNHNGKPLRVLNRGEIQSDSCF